MKKIICSLLVIAMTFSLVIVAAITSAAAVEGDWIAVGRANQYDGSTPESEYFSVAGYEYDEEGFHLTSANWAGQTPWARFVSKSTVDLKDGVYMEIRIDEFDYSSNLDSWFTFLFWDQMHMTPGDVNYGEGLYNHIRPTGNNITYWYTGSCNLFPTPNTITKRTVQNGDKEECSLFVAELSWDEENSTFVYTINGVAAPADIISYMNQKWGGDNSHAYVGFALQHSAKNGRVACTLLKYGTSAEDCSVPMGEDMEEPIDYSLNYVTAPLVEDPQIEPGKPAILMSGDVSTSNIKFAPSSVTGEAISVNDDHTVRVVASNSSTGAGIWTVENATSYAIEDFPVVMMVTRNLCTCVEEDKINGLCGAFETGSVYVMTGDAISPDSSCAINDNGVSWDSYYIDDDSYLSFIVDTSYTDFSGRVNGVRFDVHDVDFNTPGANAFDVCFIAFFATKEDAEIYFMSYIEGLGYAPEETTTEEPEQTTVVPDQTAVVPEQTTVVSEQTTVVPEQTTATPEQTTIGDLVPEPVVKNGCGSLVGAGATAIVSVALVFGAVCFKKKED